MFDLIDKLIDRLIQYYSLKKRIEKSLIDDYVEPVFQLFDEVHQYYITSLRDIKTRLDHGESDIKKICEEILEEYRFGNPKRFQLFALAKNVKNIENKDKLDKFSMQIIEYLIRSPNAEAEGKTYFINWLFCCHQQLSTIIRARRFEDIQKYLHDGNEIGGIYFLLSPVVNHHDQNFFDEKQKRDFALKVVDIIIENMQKKYIEVCTVYAKLKTTYGMIRS